MSDLPVLHRVGGQAGSPHSVLAGEGRSLVVAAVPLAQVGRHEEDVPTKLNKVLVTAAKLHFLGTDFQTNSRYGREE